LKISRTGIDTANIQKMNSLAGGLVSNAVSYGMTGSATFNRANINGVGLFELTLGNDGITSRIGMGGVDVRLGTIASAIRGGQNWGKNNAINAAANRANMENAATALRAQWGFGDEAAKEQLNSILSGDTRLAIGSTR
jgi:hypothetical protein